MLAAPLEKIVCGLRRTAESGFLADHDDAELLRRFVTGRDAAAFETLVRRHGPLVLAACRKVLSDAADVEDAFQATFLTLLRKGEKIRKQQSVGPWLFGVAHRLAVRLRADTERRRLRERKPARRASSPASDLSWREACAVLHEELDKLPDRLRLPLMLCYLEGKSRDEAARELRCPFNTVKRRLELGRAKLRGRLGRRGLVLSAGLLAAVADSAAANGLPPKLFEQTLQAATSGRYSPAVAALLRGVTPTMLPRTLKLTAVLALAAGIVAGAIGLRPATPAHANPTTPPAEGAKPQAAEATDTLAFTGRIASLENQPLKGVTVEVVRVGKPSDGDLTAWLAKNIAMRNESYWLNEGGLTMAPATSKATTDVDGKFSFAGLSRDRVLAVRVHGPAVETKFFWVVTRPDAPTEGYIKTRDFNHGVYGPNVSVLLAPSRPLVGTLRDSKTGKPVPGVVVSEANAHICKAVTDADGEYRLEGVPKKPGYALCVAGQKGVPYFDHTDHGAGDTAGLDPLKIDVTIDRGLELTGKIVDKAGKPVRAEVFYEPAGDNPNAKANSFRVITSDGWKTKPDGTFYVTVWPGKGVLDVRAGDRYASVDVEKVLAEFGIKSRPVGTVNALLPINADESKPGSLQVTITLDDAARREGSIVGPDGKPVTGVIVAGLKSGPLSPLTTSEFTITGMNSASQWMFLFLHEGKKLGAVQTLSGDSTEPVKVELRPLGSITGQVQSKEKKPWGGLTVTALPWVAPGSRYDNLPNEAFRYQGGPTGLLKAPWWKLTKRTAKTDADGRFRLDGLVPGLQYTVYITDGDMTKQNTAVTSRARIEIAPGKTHDLGVLVDERK